MGKGELMSSESMQQQVPVVDLEDLANPDPRRQRRAAEALQRGLGHFGLVYIRNHGIDAEALDSFYHAFLQFTDQDEASKKKLSGHDIWYQRGWTPPNTEKAVVAGGQPDFKECFFIAPEAPDAQAKKEYPQLYAENLWPEDNDPFRERYLAIGHQLHEVGLQLLRGSARTLSLEPYRFEAACWGGPHVTRALRYIPLTQEQVGAGILWGEEHTDFNLLTILPGGRFLDEAGEFCGRPDDLAGLYLRTRATREHPRGQMVQGSAPAGCIVAQVGQQLEILTGGRFAATPHVIKAPATTGYSRVSMAHFVHLHPHQLLFPLEPFRTDETLRAYSPPVLAGTYDIKTLVDIGLAPASALDQFGYRHYNRLDSFRKEESGAS